MLSHCFSYRPLGNFLWCLAQVLDEFCPWKIRFLLSKKNLRKNQQMFYRTVEKSTAKFMLLSVWMYWREFQQIQWNQSLTGLFPCHPVSPSCSHTAALSTAREACFFFSAPSGFDTDSLLLAVFVCIYAVERERKKFEDKVFLPPCPGSG